MNNIGKSQVFFWHLAAFIIGIAAASFLPANISIPSFIFIAGGVIIFFGVLGRRTSSIIAGFLFVTGACAIFWFFYRMPALPSWAEAGRRISLTGIIASDPVRRGQSQEFLLAPEKEAGDIRIITRPFPEYSYGDRITVAGKLDTAPFRENEHFMRMAFPNIAVIERDKVGVLWRFLFNARKAFSNAMQKHLPEPESSFLAGLLLGERQNFPEELRRDLRITGTSHITALSGYNVTIIASALFKIFMFLSLPLGFAWWSALASITAFTFATGAAASVVRAAIMGMLVLVARRSGRAYHMRNALALAAALMLIHDPFLLRFDIGFQLSFAATIGLIYGAPIIDGWYEAAMARMRIIFAGRRKFALSARRGDDAKERPLFREILTTTLAAQSAVLPLIIWYFGELSIAAPIANIAILPLIPYTMLAGSIAGGMELLVAGAGKAAALASQFFLGYELFVIRRLAGLPAASVFIGGIGATVLTLAYAGLIIFAWRHRASLPHNS